MKEVIIIVKKDYISVIGGANIDIAGYSFGDLKMGDSNPGQVNISIGGVGRNIAENLVKLENKAKMFSVVGKDLHGEKIISESEKSGIDMSYIKKTEKHSTGTYLAILNEENDMELAIASMDCFAKLNKEYIDKNSHVIKSSQIIVLDTNLEKEVFHYAVDLFKGNKLFLDTVSHEKALRAKDIIGKFHTIKPNKLEAEALSGMEIKTDGDLEKAANYFHSQGVTNVFISLGEDGVFYSDGSRSGRYRPRKIVPKNATGAGDAFQAGLVHGEIKEMNIEEKVQFAVAASILAMSSYSTINPEMSVEKVREIIKEMGE